MLNIAINDCCKVPANLEFREARGAHTDGTPPDMVVRVCKVCARRHFEVIAEPGKFGIKMTKDAP